MKRILILCNGTMVVYRFRKELVQALIEKGDEVYISAPDDGYTEDLENMGAHIISTKLDRHGKNLIKDIGLILFYRSVIKRFSVDAVLTYTIKPTIYGNIAANITAHKIPVISTITGLGDVFLNKNIIRHIVLFLYRLAFRRVSYVLFQNKEDLQILISNKIIKKHDYMIVPGSGVNLEEFSLHELPKNEPIQFLYSGRIFEAKGIQELLEASRMMREEFRDRIKVILIGYFDDSKCEALVKNAVETGYISYYGYQKNVAKYIIESHCVVLPSYSEGMSNALLEAAAMGRPLISCDIKGCREIIDDGINGFLCEPRDSDGLYNAMKNFVSLDATRRIQMGQASRKKVEREFDRNIITTSMIELIEKY